MVSLLSLCYFCNLCNFLYLCMLKCNILSFLFSLTRIASVYFQTPGLNIITEYLMGVILPGRPIANVCFKTYGYISMTQAVSFLNDFKLGHYMKIPPRSMFVVQVYIFSFTSVERAKFFHSNVFIETFCKQNKLVNN